MQQVLGANKAPSCPIKNPALGCRVDVSEGLKS